MHCAIILVSLQLVRRYTGGHKGSIYCLMNFMASSGEVDFQLSENLYLYVLYYMVVFHASSSHLYLIILCVCARAFLSF